MTWPRQRHPKPVNLSEILTTTVWVTEQTFGIDLPSVKRYSAIEIRKDSVTVIVRTYKQVIRAAAGRKFWTDEQAMWAYYQRCAHGAMEQHQRKAEKLKRLLEDGISSDTVEIVPMTAMLPGKIRLE